MKFIFQTVVHFEITKEEAVRILACHDADREMTDWLRKHNPVDTIPDAYSVREMRTALGKYLSEEEVEKAKQLTWDVEGGEGKEEGDEPW
jgi:hypothetical protein